MRGQPRSADRAPSPGGLHSIDVVILTPGDKRLSVLCDGEGSAPIVPWGWQRDREEMVVAARRVARAATGVEPQWLEQLGAFGDGADHPSGAPLSVAFVALLPGPQAAAANLSYLDARGAHRLPERQRVMVAAAVAATQSRMDQSPVAFRLLPQLFTLSELQEVYELLLGRKLHKASFRRALQASWLVEPTNEWRTEGRGRPAQLFRYAPRRRRSRRRGVKFDLL